jgi:hypothetical protein
VSFRDPETGKYLVFLTNRFEPSALTIAAIYKNRWQIELFFKWLKQNLAVKHFFGNSINAVKAQIWAAVWRLSAGADRHQASPAPGHATDFFAPGRDQHFRKNLAGSTGCKCSSEGPQSAGMQPTDFIVKSTGQ